ncbi:alcohol dehydrogenase catalytic domain-containing protein [Streptomyces sp. NPDC006208]|uniref:zinc-dependent alcohol dehydrogenase n=1 Tax=Streptomyces sp. NPDC006208 TaxID=3156734 RepID=UPI0033A738F1
MLTDQQEPMVSAVLADYGRIETRRTPLPPVGEGELLVRVLATGICGSDLATYRGAHPYKTAPTVLGHELCGTVVRAAGPFAAGDLVCAAAYSHCGDCGMCAQGRTNLCTDKRNLCHLGWDGSFAQYVMLRPAMVHRLPAGTDPTLGALVEPLSIALHAVALAGPPLRRTLRIIGAGNIGLGCLIAARRLGFGHIVCSDLGPEKGRRAAALGADAYLDVLADDAGPGLHGPGADVLVVASSHPGALDEAVQAVRPGGTVVVVSFFDQPPTVALNALVGKEVRVLGSSLSTAEDFRTVIGWLAEGTIDPLPMVTHRFDLSETGAAMALMAAGEPATGKIIIIP